MQRTGRKGHAMYRLVVQDSRRTPTSGKLVAALGSYDPHAKSASIDAEKALVYLSHGAQPSPRVARILKTEGIKLPGWVKSESKKSVSIKNRDKLRRNRSPEAEPVAAPPAPEAEPEPAASEASPEEAPAEPVEPNGADEPAAKEPKPEPEAEPAAEATETETPAQAQSETAADAEVPEDENT